MTGKSYNTPWMGGFGTTLSWKGISLSAQFSWMADRWVFNNDRYFEENNGNYSGYNQSKRLLYDRWKQPGDVTDIPRYGVVGAAGRPFPRELVVHTSEEPHDLILFPEGAAAQDPLPLGRAHLPAGTEPADLYRFHRTGPRVCGQRLYRTVSGHAPIHDGNRHHILNCNIR